MNEHAQTGPEDTSVSASQWTSAEQMHRSVVGYFAPGEHDARCVKVKAPSDENALCRCSRLDRATWQVVADQHAPQVETLYAPCAEHANERIYREMTPNGCTDCKRALVLVCASPSCAPYWPCLTAARLIECVGVTPESAAKQLRSTALTA